MRLPIRCRVPTIRSRSYVAATALGLALAITAVLAPSASASPRRGLRGKANTYPNAEIAAALSRAPDGVRVGANQVEWNNYAVVLTVPTPGREPPDRHSRRRGQPARRRSSGTDGRASTHAYFAAAGSSSRTPDSSRTSSTTAASVDHHLLEQHARTANVAAGEPLAQEPRPRDLPDRQRPRR